MEKIGPLLATSIGDAAGRPFEFNTREFITKNNTFPILGYKHRIGEKETGIGTFTDDAQMSLAIAEQMIAKVQTRDLSYAHRFIEAYRRDPRGGYSRRLTTAMNGAIDLEIDIDNRWNEKRIRAEHFLKNVKPQGASSNGCVMRTIPIGLLSDPSEVEHRSIIHCAATHSSLFAIQATIAVSLTAHYFYHNIQEPFTQWLAGRIGIEACRTIAESHMNKEEMPCDAMKTASFSIKTAMKEKSMSKALHSCIEIGGDVDSLAAIVMGLMSLKKGVVNDLPKILYDNLENGSYGRDYMKLIDARLFEMFPVNKVSTGVLDI